MDALPVIGVGGECMDSVEKSSKGGLWAEKWSGSNVAHRNRFMDMFFWKFYCSGDFWGRIELQWLPAYLLTITVINWVLLF
jgi:hypothetical protein